MYSLKDGGQDWKQKRMGDEPLARRLFLILTIFFCASAAFSAEATCGGRFIVPRAELESILAKIETTAGPLSWLEGEVVAVGQNSCTLRTDGKEHSFLLGPACEIFANGLPSSLNALRPVAPGAFFWARLWLDSGGGIRIIEAIYCGGELMLIEVGQDEMTGIAPDIPTPVTLPIADWRYVGHLVPGQSIYVLLDLTGRVRWVHELFSAL